jgi:hypothetical protein
VHAHDHDAGARLLTPQNAGDAQSGDPWQLDVEQNQTRAGLLCCPDGLVRIARLTDDLIAPGCFQHPPQAGTKHRMIVDQQHSPC